MTRRERHDHPGNAEAPGDLGCMQRARATVGHQGELAWVEAALDRDRPESVPHRRVRNSDHPERCSRRVEPERLRDSGRDRLARALRIQLDAPASKDLRTEPAEHDLRVGHRRLLTAAPVADGAGAGPRAVRADPQATSGFDRGDAAPTGSHLVDVEDGHPDRVTFVVAADEVLGSKPRRSIQDDAGLRGRATHVERDRAAEPEELAEREGSGHTSGWT